MRSIFDDEHEAFRESFSAWVDKEVVPHYLDWEEAGIAPRSFYAEAGRHGFLGIQIPERYGGGGSDDFRFNQATTTCARRTSPSSATTSRRSAGCRASSPAS
jgi:alkylation response protein AidB-like acyl-CoA dehydrogenase